MYSEFAKYIRQQHKAITNQSKEEEKDHEGIGHAFFRSFDLSQPVGDIHQIHGEGIGQREVMMTLSDKDEASRLICGLTWGGEGAWTAGLRTSDERNLEEVYCYFGMPLPHFGFHISYLRSGEVEDIVTHTVHSGTMVGGLRRAESTRAVREPRHAQLLSVGACCAQSFQLQL